MDYIHNDGFTRDDGFILGDKPGKTGERLYSDLEFTYRPAHPREVRQLDAKVEKAIYQPDDAETLKSQELAIEWVAGRIVSWSLKDRGGHPVPCNAKSVDGMHPTLFNKLYNIIRGFALNDPKPDKPVPPSEGELVGNSEAASG